MTGPLHKSSLVRILFCWELGGGFGHLFRLLPIGTELARRGCQVIYAIKDSARAEPFLCNHACQVVPAPPWPPPPLDPVAFSQTYAQNLLRNGYSDRGSLRDQLKGWLTLFDTWQPDAVLAEHAPSALLAAAKARLPRAAIGTGFALPPLQVPMPGLQPWFRLPEQYLKADEATFLDCVKPVLQDLGIPPLAAAADIFQGAEQLLCTFPELDHYGERQDAHYWGPVTYTPAHGDAPWPAEGRGNVFVYLNPRHRLFHPIIQILKEKQRPALAFAPGLDGQERRSLEDETLRIALEPVDLTEASTRCRLMVSHGGHNAAALMLLAGVPLFVCPAQLEQAAFAHRLRTQGLATALSFFDPNPDLEDKLSRALNCPQPDQLEGFWAKHATYDSSKVVEELADKCLSLAGIEAVNA